MEWLLAKSRRCGNWLFDQQTMQTNYASKPEWCSAQSHLPRNTGQSARRIDTTLSLFRHFTLWWPERSELVVMTNLSQLWSSGFCWQFTGEQLIQLSFETILDVLCLQCRLQCLSIGTCESTTDQSDAGFIFCLAKLCKIWNPHLIGW